MTLLNEQDISSVSKGLREYDEELQTKVGASLEEIAAYAAGRPLELLRASAQGTGVAVVPVSSGEGIINGFCETVASIVQMLGFHAFVTRNTDISGLEEAYNSKVGVIFIADDHKFIAINTATGKVADNGICTGRGYAAALDMMTGGLDGQEVLLLGAGPVGISAAAYMISKGASILAYDIKIERLELLLREIPDAKCVEDIDHALHNTMLIFDATPAADIIKRAHITDKTIVCAPGIPLGVEGSAVPLLKDRLVHDVLEIGVASMLFNALSY